MISIKDYPLTTMFYSGSDAAYAYLIEFLNGRVSQDPDTGDVYFPKWEDPDRVIIPANSYLVFEDGSDGPLSIFKPSDFKRKYTFLHKWYPCTSMDAISRYRFDGTLLSYTKLSTAFPGSIYLEDETENGLRIAFKNEDGIDIPIPKGYFIYRVNSGEYVVGPPSWAYGYIFAIGKNY